MRWVLMPGMDGTGLLFRPLQRHLPAGVESAVVSYPASGPQDYATMARQAAQLVGDRPCVLVAESFSGPVAVALASEHPGLVRGLVLAASFVRAPRLPAIAVGIAVIGSRIYPPRWFARRFLFGPAAPETDVQLLYRALAGIPRSVLAERMRVLLANRLRPGPPTVPVFYVSGRRDLLRGLLHATLPASGWNCRRVELDAGHFVLQGRPREAAEAIHAFSQGLPPIQVHGRGDSAIV